MSVCVVVGLSLNISLTAHLLRVSVYASHRITLSIPVGSKGLMRKRQLHGDDGDTFAIYPLGITKYLTFILFYTVKIHGNNGFRLD